MCSLDSFTALCLVVTVFTQPGVSYQYFGTKTSYFVTADTEDSPVQVDGCRPALFWNLARHGTRNPGDDDILEMGETLPSLRDQIVTTWEEGGGEMEETEIFSLIEWTFDLQVEDDSMLTESGRQEHKEMGQRWGRRLGGLTLDRDRTEVRSSSKSRCLESANAFLEGIFESDTPDIVENNKLLRFYNYCPKFITEVDENSETFVEMNKFRAGEFFQEMVTRVSIRTGLPMDVPQISLMWDMCRFGKAWFPSEVSPWCFVFSNEDLKLFEFQADLKYYYNDGAAYNITAEMTQPLFADIFSKIEEMKSSEEANVSILNFAHSETLQPFMTALGLYRDEEDLLASDWGAPRQQHKWQVSRIASFATNVGLVVFECEAEDVDVSSEENQSSSEGESSKEYSQDTISSRGSEWKVVLFHQEKPVIQPACGAEICSLDEFLGTYRHLAEEDFDAVCQE
eukprot:GFUD01037600.1.p1 GENE.GFUD01037600.1~~GFUD01037600.1.p1  ORF type:complete len:454 (-),score=120.39 GFUD01037600.1:57-1418(-)